MCLNLPFEPNPNSIRVGGKGQITSFENNFGLSGSSRGLDFSNTFVDFWITDIDGGSLKRKKCLFPPPTAAFSLFPREQVYYIFLPVCGGCYLTLIASCVFVLGPAVPELTININPSALSKVCPILHLIPSYCSAGLANYPRCSADILPCFASEGPSERSRVPTCTRFSLRISRAVNKFDL